MTHSLLLASVALLGLMFASFYWQPLAVVVLAFIVGYPLAKSMVSPRELWERIISTRDELVSNLGAIAPLADLFVYLHARDPAIHVKDIERAVRTLEKLRLGILLLVTKSGEKYVDLGRHSPDQVKLIELGAQCNGVLVHESAPWLALGWNEERFLRTAQSLCDQGIMRKVPVVHKDGQAVVEWRFRVFEKKAAS